MSGLLYAPTPVTVTIGQRGELASVGNARVEAIREEWLVEDRWWTGQPIRRHYFELVLADGRCEIVFRERGKWFSHRA